MAWIRMDPELLPGSGTRKIQGWIRIRNKSFRIHNTASPTKDLGTIFSTIAQKNFIKIKKKCHANKIRKGNKETNQIMKTT